MQFILSNQFEWMLNAFLGLLDQSLSEDVVTLAVLVMGAIKAATVLRVVSMHAIMKCQHISRVLIEGR